MIIVCLYVHLCICMYLFYTRCMYYVDVILDLLSKYVP